MVPHCWRVNLRPCVREVLYLRSTVLENHPVHQAQLRSHLFGPSVLAYQCARGPTYSLTVPEIHPVHLAQLRSHLFGLSVLASHCALGPT